MVAVRQGKDPWHRHLPSLYFANLLWAEVYHRAKTRYLEVEIYILPLQWEDLQGQVFKGTQKGVGGMGGLFLCFTRKGSKKSPFRIKKLTERRNFLF